ncbi:MAG: M56 family metallopeptidase [bacterium]
MIATWMFSAALFTLLLGVAAHCAESALRALGRQGRWAWLAALGAAIAWPALAPWIREMLPTSGSVHTFATSMPSISVVPMRLPAPVPWTQRLDGVILVLWGVATLVMIARLIRAIVLLARVRRQAAPQTIDGVPVLLSTDVGPAVIGVVSPRVLFPESLLELDAPHRRLVLEHEQEHCRARDPWFVLISSMALALVPWNLPLWWIARRARLALEIDCDARVLAANADVNGYGKLLMLISQRQTTMALSPMLAASPSQLERRIIAMRASRMPRRTLRVAIAVAGAIIAAGAACASRISDRVAGPSVASAVPLRAAPATGKEPYFEFQVEQQVRQIPATGNLRYPDSLRHANVEGEVLAQFVIDQFGQYEPGTFKSLASTHPLFTEAVSAALPNMRFYPAQVGGKNVRQLVQQPFTFSLSHDATTPRPKAVPPAKTAYIEFGIDKEAQQVPGTGQVQYPPSLRAAGVSGEVLAQFVVEQDGKIMEGSLKILRSSDPLFTEAVREALPALRFEPATVEGKAVKQLMQMPFTFSLTAGGAEVLQRPGTRPQPGTRSPD